MGERKGFFWDVMEGWKPSPPAASLLGFQLLEIDESKGTIRVRFTAKPEFTNPIGVVQGGFLAAMLDDTLGPARPQRERPCPMCTSLLGAWDGEARDIEQRVALAVVARSPIERLVALKKERGWRNLQLYSDTTGEFSRDYHAVSADGGDDAALSVLTRRDGTIRHFWSGEMGFSTADPGQDPRGAPDLMPIWTLLDSTPEGRGTDWYPKLEYDR